MDISFYKREPHEEPNCPFDGRFDADPWIAFHGTSSVNEQAIMADGLFAADQSYTRADLAALCAVFDALWWSGESTGGYAVLKNYSNADYTRGDGLAKPTHLAESSFRALRYAVPSFAGGEAARAVRLAFADLDRALASAAGIQAIRDAAFKRLRGGLQPPYPEGCAPDPGSPVEFRHLHAFWRWRLSREPQLETLRPRDVTSEWPRAELQSIRSRLAACFTAAEKWQHGLVYAVKLDEYFIPYLDYKPIHGLCCKTRISSDLIVAKSIITSKSLDRMDYFALASSASSIYMQRRNLPIFARVRCQQI